MENNDHTNMLKNNVSENSLNFQQPSTQLSSTEQLTKATKKAIKKNKEKGFGNFLNSLSKTIQIVDQKQSQIQKHKNNTA